MTTTVSPERLRFHTLLNQLERDLPDQSIVYDLGVSKFHDYHDLFGRHQYLTLDCDPNTKPKPDKVWNAETDDPLPPAAALIVNGVMEQCGDPFLLTRNLRKIVAPDGKVLFGICAKGYPPLLTDYTRFTEPGAVRLVEQGGFKILAVDCVFREDRKVPTYVYIHAKRKPE